MGEGTEKLFTGDRVSVGKAEQVLETDGGAGGTAT